MASERALDAWKALYGDYANREWVAGFDAGFDAGAADKEAEIRALREAIIQEVHRHWLFLKYERDNGGNYEHLNTRMVEAEYIEGRIRALLAGEPPASYGQSRSMDKRLEVQGKPKANQP